MAHATESLKGHCDDDCQTRAARSFEAQVRIGRDRHRVGRFRSALAAALEHDRAARELLGPDTDQLNFPDPASAAAARKEAAAAGKGGGGAAAAAAADGERSPEDAVDGAAVWVSAATGEVRFLLCIMGFFAYNG